MDLPRPPFRRERPSAGLTAPFGSRLAPCPSGCGDGDLTRPRPFSGRGSKAGFLAEGVRGSAMGFFRPRRCAVIVCEQYRRGEKSAGIGWRQDRASTFRETVDGTPWIYPSIGRGRYASLTASFTLLMTRRCEGNPAQYERNRRFETRGNSGLATLRECLSRNPS